MRSAAISIRWILFALMLLATVPCTAQLRNCAKLATAPTAVDDYVSWSGGPVVIDVLGNDYDDDGDIVAIAGFSNPPQGTLQYNDDFDALVYTPSTNAAIDDSFTYTISDGQFGDTATVRLSATPFTPPTQPPAVAAVNVDVSCENLTCYFRATLQNIDDAPRFFHWNFGTNTTPQYYSQPTAFAYFNPGQNTVTVTVTFVSGRQLTGSVTFSAVARPIQCRFEVVRPNADGPSPLYATARVVDLSNWTTDFPAYQYFWDWNDGSPHELVPHENVKRDQSHGYRAPGPRLLNFLIKTPNGSLVGQCPQSVPIENFPPHIDFTAQGGNGTNVHKRHFTFNASVSDEYYSELRTVEWNFGDGTFSTNGVGATTTSTSGMLMTHQYARPGNYVVVAKVADSLGAVGTIEKTITVPDDPPIAGWSFNCWDRTCKLHAGLSYDDGEVLTYRWNLGDGSAPVTTDAVITSYTFPADGPYDVTLTVDDGSRQASKTLRVSPRAGPIASNLLYYALPPCRVFDSRSTGNPLASSAAVDLPFAGRCGIPVEAKAVAINVTVVNPTDAGYVHLYPAGAVIPPPSAINFTPQRSPRANSFIVTLGTNGALTAYPTVGTGGTTDLILDVTGYFTDSRTGSAVSNGPLRAASWPNTPYLDTTREPPALKVDVPRSFLVRGQSQNWGGIPLDAEAAWLNVTALNPSSAGWLTLYPSNGVAPVASMLNVQASTPQGNGSIMALGRRDTDDLTVTYAGGPAGSTTDVQVDSALSFSRTANAVYHALEPCRLIDTRQAGNGAPRIPAYFSQRVLKLQGNCGVPPDDGTPLRGIAAVVRVINADSPGWIKLGNGSPESRTIYFQAGDTIANTVFLGDFPLQVPVALEGGGIDLVVDVLGYFQLETNHGPVATPDAFNAVVNVPITVNVVENDSDNDGDAVRLSPAQAVLNPPALGTAVRASDTSITYTATRDGIDAFDYLLVDPRGGTAVGKVRIDVRATDEAPRAVNDTASSLAGTTITINVLVNDSDPNGAAIRLTDDPIVVKPTRGSATRVSDTNIAYEASPRGGTDTLTYEIINARGIRARAQLTINVNRLPVAVNDAAIAQETTPVTIDVLANDSDPDGDALVLGNPAIVTAPTSGTAVVHADGRRIVYTSQAYRSDSFVYAVADASGQRSTATVTITPNRRPIANNDAFAIVTNGGPVDLNLTANDSDPDAGDVVKLMGNPIRSVPLKGTVARKNDTTVTYTPSAGASGADSFTAEVTDGRGGVATGTVALTLCSAGAAIAASPTARAIRRSESTVLTVSASGPGLSYQWYVGPSPSITTPVGTNSPQLTVAPLVNTSYWVRVSNACSFANSAAALVTVQNNPPVPFLTFNCKGTRCDFSGIGSRDDVSISNYAWSTSDAPGAASNFSSFSHVFSPGCHVATLVVTDNESASATTQQTIAAGDYAPNWPYRKGGVSADTHATSYASALQGLVNTTGNLNGVLEPGERVVLEPTWVVTPGTTTYNATATAVTSSHSSITASILARDATYSTTDGYSNCWANGKCYVIEAKANGPRGTPHVDLTVNESTTLPGATGAALVHVGGSFADVPSSAWFYGLVESITHWGLTGGCGGGNFCPTGGMTRAMIPIWLLIAKYGPAYAPPACTAAPFLDVPCHYWAATWIAQAKAEAWTTGTGGGYYSPESIMSRGEMAVFVLRALNPTNHPTGHQPPACTTAPYVDVPCSHWAAAWIADLKTRNIAVECAPDRYCPDMQVMRLDAAQTLYRAYSLGIDRRICPSGPIYTSSAPPLVPDPAIINSTPPLSPEWAVQNVLDKNLNTDYASYGGGPDTFIDFDFGAPVRIHEVTVTDRRSVGGANGSGAGGNTYYVTEFQLIFSTDATFGNADDIIVPVSSPGCCDTKVTQVNSSAGLTARYVRYDVVSVYGYWHVGAAEISFRAYSTTASNSTVPGVTEASIAETPPESDPPPIPAEKPDVLDRKEGWL